MVDNKHTPAYPTLTWEQLSGGEFVQVTDSLGISKLEFFACNAPVEIPEWFKHTPPEWENVFPPQAANIENEEHKKQVLNWVRDPIYDLPQELDWFQDAYETYWDSRRRFAIADEQAKYFQWRRYYAEQLLTELSKPQP